MFKSDRGGIEIGDRHSVGGADPLFKSDRGGIEILSGFDVPSSTALFKSDRGGIEIVYVPPSFMSSSCSNQTVAGLKSFCAGFAMPKYVTVQIRPWRD